MKKQVVVTVTNERVDMGETYPYDRNVRVWTLPFYTVPRYRIDVNRMWSFKALRFGLRYHGGPVLKERLCDVGLFTAQTLYPTWVWYDTHSFESKGIKGAWRLRPSQQYLLHEGAADTDPAGATLGCIELNGSTYWNQFLHILQEQTGVSDFGEIGRKKLLKVVIQQSIHPIATYLRSFDRRTRTYFIEPTQ